MRGLLNVLRHGWATLRGPTVPPTPFAVRCACGQTARGSRSARHQVIRCAGCGGPVFVLPQSVWPPPEPDPAGPPPRLSPWLAPVLAAAVTLVGIVALFLWLFSAQWIQVPEPGSKNLPKLAPEDHIQAGRELLGAGDFREAFNRLEAARALGADGAEFRQLHRQAELLAVLLRQPLQEIVTQARLVRRPAEWREQFEDFKGRSVIFDDIVLRDPDGGHRLATYRVTAGEGSARVRLDLRLLSRLPLAQPRRLVFGARLANVSRGEGGVWVIEFDPDSGVLMTDAEAVAALGLPLDDELREVLRRQAEWANDFP